jgi:hypothetical protein
MASHASSASASSLKGEPPIWRPSERAADELFAGAADYAKGDADLPVAQC